MRNFSEGGGDYYERRRQMHTVYKLYDAEGEIIYVGMTNDVARRLDQHRADKPWWGEVAKIEQERFPIMAEARDREREIIVSRRPRHNQNGWKQADSAWSARAKTAARKAARLKRLGIDLEAAR